MKFKIHVRLSGLDIPQVKCDEFGVDMEQEMDAQEMKDSYMFLKEYLEMFIKLQQEEGGL